MPSAADAIVRPPDSLAGWMGCFDLGAIPVLAETASLLAEMRGREDEVDAHLIAEAVSTDPLMTLKVLAQAAAMRRGRDAAVPETVTAALVLMGITPFFRRFDAPAVAEEVLEGQTEALAGFRRVLRRSHRAANFAAAFAMHRQDHDIAVLHEAALLHDFAELLLWLRAPAPMLEIAARQAADRSARTAPLQRALLHVELPELQHALMTAWGLPPLLVHVADDQAGRDPQARCVMLAVRVARHSADGWDNPAIPDDVAAVADLLHMGVEPARRLLEAADA
jgi:HD-like signal output (HDOD) protein